MDYPRGKPKITIIREHAHLYFAAQITILHEMAHIYVQYSFGDHGHGPKFYAEIDRLYGLGAFKYLI